MELKLARVEQRVGAEVHLHPLDLALVPKTVTVLLGATQAGKTTLMRLMAGLDVPTEGKVRVDGRDVTGIMAVPNTGWWQNWRTITSPSFPLHAGPHVLKILFDSAGGNLNWIEVQPAVPSTPFTGTPISLPGVIEVENYDLGGQGVAYNDLDPGNNGGAYRNEDVDIEATTDAGGGYDIGWTGAGEWLSYTVNVVADGRYTVHARVATMAPGGSFHLSLDGRRITRSVTVPGTDGWQNWQTIDIPDVPFSAGPHVLQLVFDGAGYWGTPGNFNWISVE